MPHPSKRKGNGYEVEIVHELQSAGLRAERAWGSNGNTLRTCDGEQCASDVDILVEGRLRLQAKRRKALPSYLCPPSGADAAVVRQDRGESLVILPLRLFTELLKR